ncbi:MAG: DUF1801 domain-containing protein [Bacteroidia bacterium]
MSELPEQKRRDLIEIKSLITGTMIGCKQWFLDGKNEDGKIVSNPNIGFGSCMIRYADGKSREFYRIGISANQSGISIYIFGLNSKTELQDKFGSRLGKAKVSGYCIKFNKLENVNREALQEMIEWLAGQEIKN